MKPKTQSTNPHMAARKLGLSDIDYNTICKNLTRPPNDTELAIFSVMWSEHCSYKSSRKYLRQLPSNGDCVLYGPGENAGVVAIGDNQAAVFKIESHNHPSFIEPYQGAATGVGGILRDVFCMGARPMALLNALQFGAPTHKKTRHLLAGVVRGIGDYGNCIGVPTVGGSLGFDAQYNRNILVNAMCVGLASADRIFTSQAKGAGNVVVYVGTKTGRDGIHGAAMASAGFSDDTETKRPTVQIGDPFYEKLLLEACLELLSHDAVQALQDMGAAGLTSSCVEMASKGKLGMRLDLDKVPCREPAMQAFEILLSESQERMLMILQPDKLPLAEDIFQKWDLAYAPIGVLTDDQHLIVHHQGDNVVNLPLQALEDLPEYARPAARPKPPAALSIKVKADPALMSLRQLLASPNLCSRRWVWEQYDYMVMGDTLTAPVGDAAVIRIHKTQKGLALACDGTPRYCHAEPKEGGKQAIAESWRNLTATGATPLAWTNCLNFGNPEDPDIMGQFQACLEGMGEAARALNFPVVSGNVSFYNETNGQNIPPTPVIGGVGLITDINQRAHIGLAAGEHVVLLGEAPDAGGHLECSLYAQHNLRSKNLGRAPHIDLEQEKRVGDFVRAQIVQQQTCHVHDVSDGGLLVALAEMAMASNMGINCKVAPKAPIAFWFGEDQARYVLAIAPDKAKSLQAAAARAGVPVLLLGTAQGTHLTLQDGQAISIEDLRQAYERYLPDYMDNG